MKQTKIMALLLALVLLLSGCAQLETLANQLVEKRDAQLRQLADLGRNKESFSQMTYTIVWICPTPTVRRSMSTA